jgi:hypothetical protein
VLIERDWEEHLARTYLFYATHPRWALRFEPSYEFFDRGDDFLSFFTGSFSTLRTLRAPLGVSYFNPPGLSAASITGSVKASQVQPGNLQSRA